MPWVYTLRLTEYTDAGTVQSDWEDNTPGSNSVENGLGGVTVAGQRAVIVSQRHNPEYGNMTDLGYVSSIAESHEIPSRGDAGFDPPIDLGNGIQLTEWAITTGK